MPQDTPHTREANQSFEQLGTRVEEDLLLRTPRTAPIHIDYKLYSEIIKDHRHPADRASHPIPNNWELVKPSGYPAPLIIDLQSMTWRRFQSLALSHLGCPFHLCVQNLGKLQE